MSNCRPVWAETRRADPWLLLLAVLVTGLTYAMRAWRWQSLLAPIGPHAFRHRLPHHRYRLCRQFPAARARRGGDAPVPAGAPRAPQRDVRLRDHHPRAAAGPGDRAPAVRGLCLYRGSGRDDRRSGRTGGHQVLGRRVRGGGASAASSCCSPWRGIPSGSGAPPSGSSACCRRGWRTWSRPSWRRSCRGSP